MPTSPYPSGSVQSVGADETGTNVLTAERAPITPTAPNPARPTGDRRAHDLGLRLLQAGPLVILAMIVIVFSIASPYFLTERNLQNLAAQSAIVCALGLGEFLVILVRGIDISVASVIALSVVVVVKITGNTAPNSVVQILLFLAVGLLFGAFNALVIVKGRIPQPLIVTVATLGIGAGLALLISGGNTVTGMSPAVVTIGSGFVHGIPVPAIVVVALTALLWTATRRTQWGRWLYAVGGNPEAAERLGLPVKKLVMSTYVVCGATAGIAGMLYAGRTGAASPLAGSGYELDAITAVIIGGASLLGGRGSVVNVAFGALIIGSIRNGLELLSVSAFWESVAIGVCILVALELDVARRALESKLRSHAARIAR